MEKKKSQELKDGIYEMFKNRLLCQFRNKKWQGILESDISSIVDKNVKDIILMVASHTIKECDIKAYSKMTKLKESYKGFVKLPKASFKNRIKFLIMGKL